MEFVSEPTGFPTSGILEPGYDHGGLASWCSSTTNYRGFDPYLRSCYLGDQKEQSDGDFFVPSRCLMKCSNEPSRTLIVTLQEQIWVVPIEYLQHIFMGFGDVEATHISGESPLELIIQFCSIESAISARNWCNGMYVDEYCYLVVSFSNQNIGTRTPHLQEHVENLQHSLDVLQSMFHDVRSSLSSLNREVSSQTHSLLMQVKFSLEAAASQEDVDSKLGGVDSDDNEVLVDILESPNKGEVQRFEEESGEKEQLRSDEYELVNWIEKPLVLATLALSSKNSLFEISSIDCVSTTKTVVTELHGHRAVGGSVTRSSKNTLSMLSGHGAVKIWSPSTDSCLQTSDFESKDEGHGFCSLFVPGNKYAVFGTKGGMLEIIDVRIGDRVETVKACGGSVQSISSFPDGNGFITGSSDHDVKFLEYETLEKSGEGSKHLVVSHASNMKMNDDVPLVPVSPDAKYVVVALLDCTIKVFFKDSLKFFLLLYGHKLPVLCMNVSSDGESLVSRSADQNLKIWVLDFGDCHKSILAHGGSVMAIKFVRNTYYMFSIGKDHLVKYWYADMFELLLTLEGHHVNISCISISNRGNLTVTGSYDRSIQRGERTEEPIFIEEEKEKTLEEMFESDLGTLENRYAPKEEIYEYVLGQLKEFEGMKLVFATKEGLKMEESGDKKEK